MAGSPRWKVYNRDGEYTASFKALEDAAVLIAVYGDGSSIKLRHVKTVWFEGAEKFSAGDSYDGVAETAMNRAYPRA